MKVIGIVGYIVGLNGTGNLFEVEDNGKTYLATIWADGKFHPISTESVKEHVAQGKGKLNSAKIFTNSNVDVLNVINPEGWKRIHQSTSESPEQPDNETEISDSLEFPFNISFDGKIKIDIGGVNKILKLLN
ncbi:MAG TPA: hypothetical protein VGN64_04225 [Dyadobacter sp.]|jgi:hypothetical protein|nr:hypothetical protein [Dyadobacter sp.]